MKCITAAAGLARGKVAAGTRLIHSMVQRMTYQVVAERHEPYAVSALSGTHIKRNLKLIQFQSANGVTPRAGPV